MAHYDDLAWDVLGVLWPRAVSFPFKLWNFDALPLPGTFPKRWPLISNIGFDFEWSSIHWFRK
jgi:hypothetical protein